MTRVLFAFSLMSNLVLAFLLIRGQQSDVSQAPFTNEPYPWQDETLKFNWAMNSGWLSALMAKRALFYDIQLHAPRRKRGIFYPCERTVLQSYPFREERPWQAWAPFAGGSCKWIL